MSKYLLNKKFRPDNEFRKTLHHKHRMRVRENFRKSGLAGFQPHNIVEMLLFYVIPRKDTNETAHLLVNTFGSLAGILEAPIEALMNVDGVGLEAATFIKFIHALFQAYELSKNQQRPVILSSDAAYKYLEPRFKGLNYEKFITLYCDCNGGVITETEVTQHNDSSVHADLNQMLKLAVMLESKMIVISHNHPNGFSVPSSEDRVLTEDLAKMCGNLNISLGEHIIFGKNDVTFFSKLKNFKSKYILLK